VVAGAGYPQFPGRGVMADIIKFPAKSATRKARTLAKAVREMQRPDLAAAGKGEFVDAINELTRQWAAARQTPTQKPGRRHLRVVGQPKMEPEYWAAGFRNLAAQWAARRDSPAD
jgi:hypothetical protein